MKRAVLTAVFLCAVAVLPGCPIYDHEDNGCYRSSDCAPGYSCDDRSGQCYLASDSNSCRQPADCETNTTCDKSGQCVSGDCFFSGCVSGYECDASSGVWACVSSADLGVAGAPSIPAAGAGVGAAAGASGATTVAGAGGAAN